MVSKWRLFPLLSFVGGTQCWNNLWLWKYVEKVIQGSSSNMRCIKIIAKMIITVGIYVNFIKVTFKNT